MRRFRNESRRIIYMDELYVLSSHVQRKSWSDNSLNGLHTHVNKDNI
jgi:hypothetical protein